MSSSTFSSYVAEHFRLLAENPALRQEGGMLMPKHMQAR